MKLLSALLFTSLSWSSALFAADEVTAVREGRQLVIRAGEKEILRYQAEAGELPRPDIKPAFIRGGYIQSIRTPSGKVITEDFAVGHLHHHGVWSAWTKSEFEGRQPDFWNMGDEKGKVEFVALDRIWQKDGRAGFQARHQFVDLTAKPGKVVLLETWDVSVAVENGKYLIDYTSTQTCATDAPLKLPEYHYGGIGFRGNGAWNGEKECEFLTASGLTDRLKVNTSREKWCWVGGKLDDATCGVTILCHPSNHRFPQPVRAHPKEPFFCYAPQQLGDMKIVPGRKYVSRYRFVVADGAPDAKAADGWWDTYSNM